LPSDPLAAFPLLSLYADRAIDAIRAKSKQPPVILLQADEGFEANETDWGEKAVRDMRVKGISALISPACRTSGPPTG
jgi:hypothetical protein